jgi:hypothetical protein
MLILFYLLFYFLIFFKKEEIMNKHENKGFISLHLVNRFFVLILWYMF